MARILVIDDAIRFSLKLALEDADPLVKDAANGGKGMTRFRSHPADPMITDILMPGKERFDRPLMVCLAGPFFPGVFQMIKKLVDV